LAHHSFPTRRSSDLECAAVAPLALGEQVQGRANAERRQDVCRNLEAELAPDLPSLLVGGKVDLATHDHGDELVARGEPLFLDTRSEEHTSELQSPCN